MACFTSKGYNNTTMDDIVAKSGLSKGSLYWYFKSKDELFAEAIMSVFMDVGEGGFALLEQYATATDKLRGMAQMTAEVSKEIEGFFGLFLEFWVSSSQREQAGQLWLGMLVEFKDAMVGIVEEGIENGEFKPVDVEQLVWAIMSAYDGMAAYAMLLPEVDIDRIGGVFIETLLSGLAVESERQGE